jgi:flavin-dependent dehydrogenase
VSAFPLKWDLVIIGGGPAGSTLASVIKRYHPKKRVLIVEREKFPRHHIGESMLPYMIPALKEMGVYEKIENAGFTRKGGGVYVWGVDRNPWEIVFGGENDKRSYPYGWQVERARYDQILLEHARECGARVLEETSALEYEPSVSGRPGRLRIKGKGEPVWLETEFVADCSGQAGFLSRYFKVRKLHKQLSNLAVYGYYRCDPFRNKLAGTHESSRIVTEAVEDGWLWYIPLSKDLVSVGFVGKKSALSTGIKKDLKELFESRLKMSASMSAALAGAERVKGVDGGDRELFVIQDYTYLNEAAHGPGWLAAGDAAYFVDPIISTGVFMAHMTGLRAAYNLNMHWRTTDAASRKAMWKDYDLFVQRLSGVFVQMALFWYGAERSTADWCSLAQRLTPDRVSRGESGLQTFIALVSGTSPYEEAITPEEGIKAEAELTREVLNRLRGRSGEDAPRDRGRSPDGWKPRLLARFRLEPGFRMKPGTGELVPCISARFPGKDRSFAGLEPGIVVSPEAVTVLEEVERGLSADEIVEVVIRRYGASKPKAMFIVNNFLQDLAEGGLIA